MLGKAIEEKSGIQISTLTGKISPAHLQLYRTIAGGRREKD